MVDCKTILKCVTQLS